jgi:hypothetical protein
MMGRQADVQDQLFYSSILILMFLPINFYAASIAFLSWASCVPPNLWRGESVSRQPTRPV